MWLGIQILEEHTEHEVKLLRDALADVITSNSRLSSEIRDQGLVLTEHVNNQRPEPPPDPPEIRHPITCTNDHIGVLRVSVLEEVSKDEPWNSRVVGGAFYCPVCGDSFYYIAGRGRFKAPAQKPEQEAPGKPAPPPPAVKFRRGREQ